MHHLLQIAQPITPTPMPTRYMGNISSFDSARHCWVIDDHFSAQSAVSLLVKPEAGDLVEFMPYQNDNYIIVQILQRTEGCKTIIQSTHDVCWIAPKVSIQAQDALELAALNCVSISGDNVVQSAQQSSVQRAQTMVLNAEYLSASADTVMNLTAKQQMLIAEEEVRIDGERINMG